MTLDPVLNAIGGIVLSLVTVGAIVLMWRRKPGQALTSRDRRADDLDE